MLQLTSIMHGKPMGLPPSLVTCSSVDLDPHVFQCSANVDPPSIAAFIISTP
jgi:hypothetical protein